MRVPRRDPGRPLLTGGPVPFQVLMSVTLSMCHRLPSVCRL